MSKMPSFTAVLFDLDDTLNDRQLSWQEFVPRFQNEYSERLSPCDAGQIARAISTADQGGYRPKSEFFAELCQTIPWRNAPRADELEKFWRSCFAECMVARSGAEALLRNLHRAGFRLGIVSNGHTKMQRGKIAKLGFDAFVTTITISESVGIKKPDRRIFDLTLEKMGCVPESTLVVGDHPVLDISGAHHAGMPAAWLSLGRSWPNDLASPEYTISGLEKLRGILNLQT